MKKTTIACTLSALFIVGNITAQVKPVDPSTFAGHYYTEVKMEIENGYVKKKTDEFDMTFDASTGNLTGVVKGFENKDKLVFVQNNLSKNDRKIFIYDNINQNGINYGKPMFSNSYVPYGVFIEEGVFVLCSYTGGVDPKVKAFDMVMEESSIRIIAKDRSKLTMNKLEAAKKAEELVNASMGSTMTKMLDAQRKADFAVPNETISKTDKAVKADVLDFFKNLGMPADDQTTFICAYTTSPDWNIIRNSSGIILGREIAVEMIRKGNVSGKCRRYPYILTAQYNGSSYGKLGFKTKYDMVECDCAEAEKNK